MTEQPSDPRTGTPLSELELPDPPAAPVEPVVVQRVNWLATLAIGALVLVLGFGAGYAVRPMLDPSAPALPTGAASSSAGATLLDVITAQVRHYKGSDRAPVTIIEYSDFQ